MGLFIINFPKINFNLKLDLFLEIKNKLDQFIKLWKNGLDILPYKENNLIHSNKIRERLQTLKFRDLLNAMREVIQDEKKETKEGKRKMKQKDLFLRFAFSIIRNI
ncbi:hypothetical protein Mgra_00008572 [Meloidogyne graminicola]|uniref:Uncharacterized protein n=1 Tax=Meloidogyne graminicola TaxID=189291 RepID=A0A8S9ZFC4_9BILA|nr:hypothetical protein Mgra_00008572 [Meloidogyne graminicola]